MIGVVTTAPGRGGGDAWDWARARDISEARVSCKPLDRSYTGDTLDMVVEIQAALYSSEVAGRSAGHSCPPLSRTRSANLLDTGSNWWVKLVWSGAALCERQRRLPLFAKAVKLFLKGFEASPGLEYPKPCAACKLYILISRTVD